MKFSFGSNKTQVIIKHNIPIIDEVSANTLVIADENTAWIAEKICTSHKLPVCLLKSGEENKNWQSVETILAAARKACLGRDGKFIGVGGGVIGDLTAFAASVYMRGCGLDLVSTTLLAMVDASVGGKTGFDLFGIKNFAGTFYPARTVYIPTECLSTLPQREFKSGIAELIKTAILSGDNNFMEELSEIAAHHDNGSNDDDGDTLQKCIKKAVAFKGKIVTEDPLEKKGKRMLLNLGHTFGHALEAAAGLGSISHGEAVAWGIIQSCALGIELGITPKKKAQKIKMLISSFGYDCSSPHPLAATDIFFNALTSDKKKKQGKLTFIVPDKKSAQAAVLQDDEIQTVKKILIDGYNF